MLAGHTPKLAVNRKNMFWFSWPHERTFMVYVHLSLLLMLKDYLNTIRAKPGKLLYEPDEQDRFLIS